MKNFSLQENTMISCMWQIAHVNLLACVPARAHAIAVSQETVWSGNEIWPVYAILQNKIFYQKLLWKIRPGN